MERSAKARQDRMDQIVESYIRLVDDEVKDLMWLAEHSHVVKAYEAAVNSIRDIKCNQDDIEEFTAKVDRSNKIPYTISGPPGIFISALVNHSRQDYIVLELRNYHRIFHFLGYRLPEGKSLIIQGIVGDYTGASLFGGHLQVEGSTGNWCGAGMLDGEILITENAGQKTGEGMRGGEIRVGGRIDGLGESRFGGRIYRRDKIITQQGHL